ncbi:hypothetical protein [Gordonia rhizosphera]|uniref:Uncharacterized protein n=1 Tax=Gordonia rhizosphera NBRC 16068 TaxID=1108045 RepID=K6W2R6_9ACTN|nr:hypothetical protein [Gordonia rhizosphera]GAB93455.1 hypothetical protein GORHZ_222_00100 [Gordonia rhizosphera NBRC 16068]
MTSNDPTDLLAEIEASDAAEAEALAQRQRRRRAALEPAALLAAEIATTREDFLAEDRRRLVELADLVKQAKKNDAPAAALDRLVFTPMTTQPRTRTGASKRPPRRTPPPPAATPAPSQNVPAPAPDGSHDPSAVPLAG